MWVIVWPISWHDHRVAVPNGFSPKEKYYLKEVLSKSPTMNQKNHICLRKKYFLNNQYVIYLMNSITLSLKFFQKHCVILCIS